MRERIIVQEPTETLGAKRGITETWGEFSTRLRHAERKALTGSERFTEQRERGARTTVFETRYAPGVTNKMRVLAPDVTTTVTEALDTTETGVDVNAATGFPGENYRVVVDHGTSTEEIMEVTGGQGTTTWTVTRGMDGTSGVAHTSGATVRSLTIHDIQTVIPLDRSHLQLVTEDVL